MSVAATIGLFLPVFLCLELSMAAPGRDCMKDVLRSGVRNFARHAVLLTLGVLAFHFVTGWFVSRGPL